MRITVCFTVVVVVVVNLPQISSPVAASSADNFRRVLRIAEVRAGIADSRAVYRKVKASLRPYRSEITIVAKRSKLRELTVI